MPLAKVSQTISPKVFCKKHVLKDFTKTPALDFVLVKLQASLQRTPFQVVSCKFWKKFQIFYFAEYL